MQSQGNKNQLYLQFNQECYERIAQKKNEWNKVFGILENLPHMYTTGPKVIKRFSCSTQLSMKFHLVIKIKIPKI